MEAIQDNQVLGDIDKAHKFGGKPRVFPERTLEIIENALVQPRQI